MNREDYIELYKQNTNSGFFTQERYVKKNYPEIYKDIFVFKEENEIDPLNFRELYNSYVTGEIFRRPKTQKEFIDFHTKFKENNKTTAVICSERYIKGNFPEVYSDMFVFRDMNKLEPQDFSDLLLYYLNDVKEQNRCVTCGKPMHYYSVIACSKKCLKSHDANEIRMGKIKQTLIDRYGADNTLAGEKAKKKYNETLKKNYGVTGSPFASKEVRDKAKETLQKNYGVDNPSFSPEIVEKIRVKVQNAYDTRKEEIKDKVKATNLIRYGNSNYMLSDKCYEYHENLFIEKIKIYNSDKLISINYNDREATFICEHGHEYTININALYNRYSSNVTICTICNPINTTSSIKETQLYEWCSLYNECIASYRKINGKEIDIFIPSLNLGIEFNGIYWHSDKFKSSTSHLDKTALFKEHGIRLIHIMENDWDNLEKREIIKGRLLNLFNIGQIHIGARECIIKEIDNKIAREFLDKNHIQGFIQSSLYIGLYYKDEIIGCLTVGKRNIGKNSSDSYELLRSCTKIGYNISGGFSKMFKYALKKLPGDYVSYADRCWGEGESYKYAGFEFSHYSAPNYWYYIDGIKYHRSSFMKHKLVEMGYDKNKTEFQIMDEDVKAFRVYDCGNAVWKYKMNKNG